MEPVKKQPIRNASLVIRLLLLFGVIASVVGGTYYVNRIIETRTQIFSRATGIETIFYVSPSGDDANAGTIDKPWKTISKANITLTSGQTVYLRAGTYSQSIQPQSNNVIYKTYNNEEVYIDGAPVVFDLAGRSHIIIDGIRSRKSGYFGTMINGHHNTLSNCILTGSELKNWGGIAIRTDTTKPGLDPVNQAQYNTIRNCKIYGHGNYYVKNGVPTDEGDMIEVRIGADFTTIENNEFFNGGHTLLSLQSKFNVIRNNFFHHEVWKNGYGNRTMNTQGTAGGWSLIEGNRFAFPSVPNDADYSDGIQMATSNNIVRYNMFYQSVGNGLKIGVFNGFTADNNMVYNNVFYKNGVNSLTSSQATSNRSGLKFAYNNGQAMMKGNIVKNNIYYQNVGEAISYQAPTDIRPTLISGQTVVSNLLTGDPQFVESQIYDFHLKSTSPARNAGTFLAKATTSGSNTTQLMVDHEGYFSDGFGITAADWIQIEGASPVQISDIDYKDSQQKIVLKEARSWSVDASIYLFKNSRGEEVLSEGKPDLGAYEIFSNVTVSPTLTQTPTPTSTPTKIPTITRAPSPSKTPTPTPFPPTLTITSTLTPTLTPVPPDTCPRFAQGNATCDGQGTIDLLDIECWKYEYVNGVTLGNCTSSDFDSKNGPDILDYAIVLNTYIEEIK